MERSAIESLRECVSQIVEPRITGRCERLLIDVVAITLLAVLCGADDFVAVETFAMSRHAWLQQFFELPNGIPAHDTFGRVLGIAGNGRLKRDAQPFKMPHPIEVGFVDDVLLADSHQDTQRSVFLPFRVLASEVVPAQRVGLNDDLAFVISLMPQLRTATIRAGKVHGEYRTEANADYCNCGSLGTTPA